MEKGQSKVRSFIEANVNTAIGFLVTLLISPIAYNTVGMKWNYNQLWQITAIFTIVSVIRGYIIRRFFNKKEEKKDDSLLKRLNYYTKLAQNHLNKSQQWENLYRASRTKRVELLKQLDAKDAELDMCKHLHTAAVSDLVEGADYHHGDTTSFKHSNSDDCSGGPC